MGLAFQISRGLRANLRAKLHTSPSLGPHRQPPPDLPLHKGEVHCRPLSGEEGQIGIECGANSGVSLALPCQREGWGGVRCFLSCQREEWGRIHCSLPCQGEEWGRIHCSPPCQGEEWGKIHCSLPYQVEGRGGVRCFLPCQREEWGKIHCSLPYQGEGRGGVRGVFSSDAGAPSGSGRAWCHPPAPAPRPPAHRGRCGSPPLRRCVPCRRCTRRWHPPRWWGWWRGSAP